MSKSSNFFGQPIYGQLIKSLNREKIVEFSRKHGGEKYVKSFDGYTHLLTMLYAVIQRFDSLREIETSMTAEVRKLHHVGIDTVPRRSTLSDANARRSEKFFEEVYRDLYAANNDILSSDSRRNGTEEWIKQLRIIDSTTITLFSNAIFKGVGRHPKTGKKKGGIKVHSVIHANEGVPCDVQFTSAATNDSFMLAPSHYSHNEIVALDRAYINYAKFEELTDRDVVYVTKMKKNLSYEVLVDCMYQNPQGLTEYREQVVVFRRDGISHIARIITYVDIKKGKRPKLISLLTNDFDMPLETIVAIYRRRWQIESLFKQIKQNFPLAVLLRRKCQRHQDPDMGHTHCKSAAVSTSKQTRKTLELLRASYNRQNCADVLPEFRKVPQSARCRPENHACRSIRATARAISI